MTAAEIYHFDVAEYIESPETQATFIAEAFRTGDANCITRALGLAARARGLTAVAREAGVTRQALYKALNTNGDPRLSTLLGVTKALGLRLDVRPIRKSGRIMSHREDLQSRVTE